MAQLHVAVAGHGNLVQVAAARRPARAGAILATEHPSTWATIHPRAVPQDTPAPPGLLPPPHPPYATIVPLGPVL